MTKTIAKLNAINLIPFVRKTLEAQRDMPAIYFKLAGYVTFQLTPLIKTHQKQLKI